MTYLLVSRSFGKIRKNKECFQYLVLHYFQLHPASKACLDPEPHLCWKTQLEENERSLKEIFLTSLLLLKCWIYISFHWTLTSTDQIGCCFWHGCRVNFVNFFKAYRMFNNYFNINLWNNYCQWCQTPVQRLLQYIYMSSKMAEKCKLVLWY